jgi:hypothetical protein
LNLRYDGIGRRRTSSQERKGLIVNQFMQVFDHRFPSGADWHIAGLSNSLDDLAARLAVDLQSWDEDGLGRTRGAFIRLLCGRVVLICEFANAPKNLGWRGTDVMADAGAFVELGAGPLIDEVVCAFGLSRATIAWTASIEDQQKAAKVLHAWHARQEGR